MIPEGFSLASFPHSCFPHSHLLVTENDSFFGEMSLLNNEKRSATVSARTDTECLILNRKDFDELLGPLEGIIAASVKRKSDLEERSRRKSTSGLLMNQLKHFSGVFSNAPATSPTQGTSSSNLFELDQLDRLRKIAQGSFAGVYLVQHYFTNKHYVMKVIPKEGLRRSNTEVGTLFCCACLCGGSGEGRELLWLGWTGLVMHAIVHCQAIVEPLCGERMWLRLGPRCASVCHRSLPPHHRRPHLR